MAGDLDRVQAQLEELGRELGEVKRRLERLEAGGGAAAGEPAPAVSRSEADAAALAPGADERVAQLPTRIIGLVGRTLLVLAGGFVFRAIRDRELLPPQLVAGVALLYAAWWLMQAGRSAGAGHRLSASFHGVAAALVAYPLIWEATTRFQLFNPVAAAVALFAFLVLGLVVAWRRELWEIGWVLVLFNLVTVVSLMVGTHDFLPLSAELLLAAVAVEILALRERWFALRWPAALGIDLAALMVVSSALRPESASAGQPMLAPGGVIAIVLALPLIYLVSIGARTLVRKKPITIFGLVQAAVALLVGFGGALRVIAHHGMDSTAIGVTALLLGGGCYAAAFTSIDRHAGRGRNFYSYTTFAGLLVLIGCALVLGDAALALVWCALALGASGLGGRFDRITLKFHGAVYAVAAAIAAGLIACAAEGLLDDPGGAWRSFAPLGIGVALVAVACYGLLVATRRPPGSPWYEFLPQAILAALVVWSAAGMAAWWLGRGANAAAGGGTGAAFVAASRTWLVALAAVILAWAGRRWSLPELLWLVYPVLVAGGFKLLWEDLQFDEPVALFIALGAYGGALIATPRLMRKEA